MEKVNIDISIPEITKNTIPPIFLNVSYSVNQGVRISITRVKANKLTSVIKLFSDIVKSETSEILFEFETQMIFSFDYINDKNWIQSLIYECYLKSILGYKQLANNVSTMLPIKEIATETKEIFNKRVDIILLGSFTGN